MGRFSIELNMTPMPLTALVEIGATGKGTFVSRDFLEESFFVSGKGGGASKLPACFCRLREKEEYFYPSI